MSVHLFSQKNVYCVQKRIGPFRKKQVFISKRSNPAKMLRTGSGPVTVISGHNISFSKPLILHSPRRRWASQIFEWPVPVIAPVIRLFPISFSSPLIHSSVLRIRKYFYRIRIRGAVILTYGSRSRRPINYGSDRIRILPDIFVPNETAANKPVGLG
jgi:hypothetical protein